MDVRVIEREADSLEEAIRILHADENIIVLEESDPRRERRDTVEGVADTVEEALTLIRNQIPAGAVVEAEETKVYPARVAHRVKADDEEGARKEVAPGRAAVIESITLHKKGRRWLWGLFKTRSVYEVTVFQRAVVEVKFRERARIRATVRSYRAKDLLECVGEVRASEAPPSEVLRLLNPRGEDEMERLLKRILDPDLFELPAALDLIEGACRMDEAANWRKAIDEAHHRASRERERLRIELRGMDVELADVFQFFTSLDWYPKSHREPTGLPMRDRWGHNPPDPTKRKVIPCYCTDSQAFAELERRAKEFNGTYDLYKQCLAEAGLDEAAARLRHKCAAMLKARKSQLQGGK